MAGLLRVALSSSALLSEARSTATSLRSGPATSSNLRVQLRRNGSLDPWNRGSFVEAVERTGAVSDEIAEKVRRELSKTGSTARCRTAS